MQLEEHQLKNFKVLRLLQSAVCILVYNTHQSNIFLVVASPFYWPLLFWACFTIPYFVELIFLLRTLLRLFLEMPTASEF